MWPWEHAALGYLLFSLALHAVARRSPSGESAVLLLVGALLPDLVDKPLAWELGLFPTGYGAAHSALVAVPVGLIAIAVAVRRDRTVPGVAVVVGYWSHLLADVVDPLRAGGSVSVQRVLWPIAPRQPYGEDLGLSRGLAYLVEFVTEFPSTAGTGTGLLFLLFPVGAVALWVYDGAPGPGVVWRLATGERR